jgi:hypothetical protein
MHLAYTNVEKLDDALAALNGARQAFRPEFCLIRRAESGRSIIVQWSGAYSTREINSATTVVWRAKQTVDAALNANPGLRIINDHMDSWVAIRT